MDPKQTLIDLLEAIHGGHVDDAREFFGYLIEWIGKGGFAPDCTAAITALEMEGESEAGE